MRQTCRRFVGFPETAFAAPGGQQRPRCLRRRLQQGTTDQQVIADKELRLYDYSAGIPTAQQGTAQQGTFKPLTDEFGNVTSVTSHTASGLIQEVQSSNTVGSTTVTESYLYTYISSGILFRGA
ncbi:MAG TPA: hypothetical protein VG099_24100 [Gemmataceae bacterium]|nr:hypothetical protein [Gemmataceae bacterium]